MGARLRPRGIRARVTLWATLAILLIAALAVGTVAVLLRHSTESNALQTATSAARDTLTDAHDERFADDVAPPQDGVPWIQVVDPEGHVLAASAALAEGQPMAGFTPDDTEMRAHRRVCTSPALPEGCYIVVAMPCAPTSPYGEGVVYAAVRLPATVEGLSGNDALFAAAATLGAALSVLVLWLAIGRALRPVGRLQAELERLSASNLDKRLSDPGTGDELADLVATANRTLDRLDAAMSRQRRFASDASHELRNPIAALRTRLEVELAEPDAPSEDLRQALSNALVQCERLEAIVNDLLALSSLDAEVAGHSELIEFDGLVAAEVARRGQAVRLEKDPHPVRVLGSRVRLARLVVNLLANAERHARSRIGVVVRSEARQAVLEVHDDGPGVPERYREHIFERFARLEDSRRLDPRGSGLGLPLSREIARAHGGTLEVGDSPMGGAVFTVRLPVAD